MRAVFPILALLLGIAVGCQDKPGETADTGPFPEPDGDGDGYPASSDCDDNNAAISPDADEVLYDGVDNDCDPETLDDDIDGDGFELADDCDDSDDQIHPDAPEIPYDGEDNDCDPETPDDDIDGDGFPVEEDCDDTDARANPDGTEVPYDGVDNDCDPSTIDDDFDFDGYGIASDCNEGDADIHPGVLDICENGIDENCSGHDRPCTLTGTLDAQDGDAWLDTEYSRDYCSFHVVADTDRDGADGVVLSEAPEPTTSSVSGGFLFDGPFDGGVIGGEELDAQLFYRLASYYVTCEDVVSAGDINGDGYGDLVASWKGDMYSDEVLLLFGPLDSIVDTVEEQADIAILMDGSTDGDLSAYTPPISIDNFNQSGFSGIGVQDSGDVWVFQGPLDSISKSGDTVARIIDDEREEGATGDLTNLDAEAGDSDGDGFSDYMVADSDYSSDYRGGVVYLLMGPLSGTLYVADAEARVQGVRTSSRFGYYGSGVGDTNGDGYPDIAIAAITPGSDGPQGIYIFQSVVTGTRQGEDAEASYQFLLDYENSGAVVFGGDINADGYSDLVFDAILKDHSEIDVLSYLLPGPLSGTYDHTSSQIQATIVNTAYPNLRGDFNADGFADIAVGGNGTINFFYGGPF